MSNLKIGDKVNFVLGTSLLTGTITKFYKNPYDRDECSVKTEVGTYSHILLHRVSKIEDNQILEEKDTQIADLQHKLEVAEKALELACKCIPCKNCPHSNGAQICYIAQDIGHYQSEKDCIADKSYYFKLKAEKELKGE